jgi:hypothetical protein
MLFAFFWLETLFNLQIGEWQNSCLSRVPIPTYLPDYSVSVSSNNAVNSASFACKSFLSGNFV